MCVISLCGWVCQAALLLEMVMKSRQSKSVLSRMIESFIFTMSRYSISDIAQYNISVYILVAVYFRIFQYNYLYLYYVGNSSPATDDGRF